MMIHLAPGDAAQAMLGPMATGDTLAKLRRDLGLSDPVADAIRAVAGPRRCRAIFGNSIRQQRPVSRHGQGEVQETAILGGVSLVVAVSRRARARLRRRFEAGIGDRPFRHRSRQQRHRDSVVLSRALAFVHLRHAPRLAAQQRHVRIARGRRHRRSGSASGPACDRARPLRRSRSSPAVRLHQRAGTLGRPDQQQRRVHPRQPGQRRREGRPERHARLHQLSPRTPRVYNSAIWGDPVEVADTASNSARWTGTSTSGACRCDEFKTQSVPVGTACPRRLDPRQPPDPGDRLTRKPAPASAAGGCRRDL